MPWRRKSYDGLPGLSVRRGMLRQCLRTVTIAWMFGVVWMTVCTYGPQRRIYFRMLGFDDFAFGLAAAVPYVATFGQLLAAMLIDRTGLKKYQFITCGLIHRATWLAIAAIPLLLPIPPTAAVVLILMLLLTGRFAEAMGCPAWITWMGMLIPPRVRGRYIGRRAQLSTIVQVVAAVGVGLLLDAVQIEGVEETVAAQPALLHTISIMFAAAAVFGLVDILLFHKIPEILPSITQENEQEHLQMRAGKSGRSDGKGASIANANSPTIRRMLWEPLMQREFRGYVLFGATITMAMTIGGPYFILNAQENVGLNNIQTIILFAVVGPVMCLLSAKQVGKAIDTLGRKPVMILGTIGKLISVSPWFFLTADTPGKIAILLLPFLVGGVSWNAIMMAQFNVTMRFADGSGQSRYVAAFGFLVSLGGILGGMIGGVITKSLGFISYENPIVAGPFEWNNWHVVFAISLLLRAMALFWLRGLHDPGATATRVVAMHAGTRAANMFSIGLFYTLRVFGWKRWPPAPLRQSPKRTRRREHPPTDT